MNQVCNNTRLTIHHSKNRIGKNDYGHILYLRNTNQGTVILLCLIVDLH